MHRLTDRRTHGNRQCLCSRCACVKCVSSDGRRHCSCNCGCSMTRCRRRAARFGRLLKPCVRERRERPAATAPCGQLLGDRCRRPQPSPVASADRSRLWAAAIGVTKAQRIVPKHRPSEGARIRCCGRGCCCCNKASHRRMHNCKNWLTD